MRKGGMETRCGQNGPQRPHFEHLGCLAPDMGLRGLIWCIWVPWSLLLSESVTHFGLLSESVPHFGEKAVTTACTADLDL